MTTKDAARALRLAGESLAVTKRGQTEVVL